VSESPYAAWATAYWELGWRGVLPLPAGQKSPPPEGWTGADAPMPSYADVLEWVDMHPGANLGIRLPQNVIGLDVDHYGGKRGGDVLAEAEGKWGALPATWTSSARTDGISGIRLFLVPEGLRWPGEIGKAVEVIQWRHRYFVAPPSLHPEGMRYCWAAFDGERDAMPPRVHALPWLPEPWVAALTRGELAQDFGKLTVPRSVASAWLASMPAGPICRSVNHGLQRARTQLTGGDTSRHDAALRGVMHLTRLASEGHRGVQAALAELGRTWEGVVTGDGSRTAQGAAGEWERMTSGAVGIALSAPRRGPTDVDPCLDPFQGLMRRAAAPTDPTHPETRRSAAQTMLMDASTSRIVDEEARPADTQSDESAHTMADARQAYLEAEVERLQLQRDARRLLDEREAAAAWREPPSWDLPALLAMPEEPLMFTVAELMPTGSNVLLTAQFKAGKTTLVSHLAACLADGKAFLGRFDVTPGAGRIALWNYEVSPAQFAAWLRRLSIGAAERVVGINLRGYVMPLLTPRAEGWAVDWLARHEVEHWIVDPWGRAITGTDENSNSEVGRWVETLDAIKERAGVKNLIVPTHTGRAEQEQGAERARGAARLDDWADVRWILTVQEGTRYFRAHGRDVDVPEGALEFDPLMRALSWADGAREKSASPGRRRPQGNVFDELIVAIGQSPGTSGKGLARLLGRRADSVLAALRAMESQGQVVRPNGANSGYWLPGVTTTEAS